MGFHSLLQSKNIPFESALAESFNRTIFQRISNMVEEADGYLCQARGPAAGLTKNRFAHKTAIAPNSSTSIILNTSPSIEPWSSNYFTQKTKSGAFIVKNPYLEKVLKQYYSGVSLTNVWKSIRDNHGSVLHLEALTDQEKAVFKTAAEIDQHWVVHHAAVRQAWIDQGQSVNLFFPTGANVSYYNQVHLNAWKKGLKTLYYVRANAARNIQSLRFSENGECLSCQ
jgi:ribonucleoside-diphosphate reductase alpha chain